MPKDATEMGLAIREQDATAPQEQLAALPWRRGGHGVEVLMVTSRISGHWLIPKGWPMPGRTAPQAAQQEALEEAGITGRIGAGAIGSYRYDKLLKDGSAIACLVDVYPLLVESELDDWRERAARQRRWFSLAEASARAYEPGLRALLGMLDPAELAATSPA
jgi:8-oxo-dGTP pyrophosphatase MutT (NUDIX family)